MPIVAQYFNHTILVDGNKTKLKANPVTINGSTYLPMRELAETLNHNVQSGYDRAINLGYVTILKGNVKFRVNYNNGNITIEDKILETFK